MTDCPLRLVLDVDDAHLQAALEECEAEVFTAWFGNTAEDLAREYGPYPCTHWLAVLDDDDKVYGVSRLFMPSGQFCKTLDDIAIDPWNVDPAAAVQRAHLDLHSNLDFATCAVRPGLGRTGLSVSHSLLYGWFAVARANGCTSMTFILDATPDRMLQDLGLHFHTIPGTNFAPYFGSPRSRPVYGHVDELIAHQRQLNPAAHHAIIRGIGLRGVTVPPISSFALAEPDEEERGA